MFVIANLSLWRGEIQLAFLPMCQVKVRGLGRVAYTTPESASHIVFNGQN